VEQLDVLEDLDLAGSSAPSGDAARAAVALHHAYSGIETILLRLARELDGGEPLGPDWHQALLDTMSLDIAGVRPAVISRSTVPDLRAMLGFRHFFRHAYSVALDPTQLASLRLVAQRARGGLETDLDRLDVFLAGLSGTALPDP
jgi:hypothetical protein